MPKKTLTLTAAAEAVEQAQAELSIARANLDRALAALRAATDAAASGEATAIPGSDRTRPVSTRKPMGGGIDPETVRGFHAQGLNDIAIAEALKTSPRKIQRMRSAMGLPGLNGRPRGHGPLALAKAMHVVPRRSASKKKTRKVQKKAASMKLQSSRMIRPNPAPAPQGG